MTLEFHKNARSRIAQAKVATSFDEKLAERFVKFGRARGVHDKAAQMALQQVVVALIKAHVNPLLKEIILDINSMRPQNQGRGRATGVPDLISNNPADDFWEKVHSLVDSACLPNQPKRLVRSRIEACLIALRTAQIGFYHRQGKRP